MAEHSLVLLLMFSYISSADPSDHMSHCHHFVSVAVWCHRASLTVVCKLLWNHCSTGFWVICNLTGISIGCTSTKFMMFLQFWNSRCIPGPKCILIGWKFHKSSCDNSHNLQQMYMELIHYVNDSLMSFKVCLYKIFQLSTF